MKHKVALVLVEWVDSRVPIARWAMLRDIVVDACQPAKCQTVGWLIKRTKDAVLIAQSFADSASQVNGVITIATKAIVKIHKLKEPKVKL